MNIGIRFKQHFDIRSFAFYNLAHPRMLLSLDLLSEYRIQHGTIGPLNVTSRYSTRIFYRGVSGFATDCPCGVWYRGLTTCLLYVWKSTFKQQFGRRFDIMDCKSLLFHWYLDIYNCICLNTSYDFLALFLQLEILNFIFRTDKWANVYSLL